jgi:hypothetical protein
MKARYLIAALSLLISAGCAPKQAEVLTQQQKDQIIGEVTAVADSTMAAFQKMDWKGGLQYYADTPDWVMFNADGTNWDYKKTEATMAAMTDISGNPMTAWKWTTTSRRFMIVNKDLVVVAWVGKDESTMKSGDIVVYDPHAYTMIVKRIDGQWKFIWSHDSGVPVTKKVAATKGTRP